MSRNGTDSRHSSSDLALCLALASSVLILLLGFAYTALPEIREILDGREILEVGRYNYVRNSFELTSFVATTLLLLTALLAFAYTRSQIREARHTRLAALYATLEARWSSAEMLESRVALAKLRLAYKDDKTVREAAGQAPELEAYSLMEGHIDDLRSAQAGRAARSYLSNMPPAYDCFTDLTRKFAERFADRR